MNASGHGGKAGVGSLWALNSPVIADLARDLVGEANGHAEAIKAMGEVRGSTRTWMRTAEGGVGIHTMLTGPVSEQDRGVFFGEDQPHTRVARFVTASPAHPGRVTLTTSRRLRVGPRIALC